MRIRFLVDYRGVLTDERYYKAGSIVDLPKSAALVAEGRAEFMTPAPPAPLGDKVDLSTLDYRELQALAKEFEINAGQKKAALIAELEKVT